MIAASQFQMMAPPVGHPPIGRLAGGVRVGPFVIHWVYPCADGYVTVSYLFGAMMGPYTARLFQWMHEHGECDADLAGHNWVEFALDVFEGRLPASEIDRGTEAIRRFVATRTKEELLHAALDRTVAHRAHDHHPRRRSSSSSWRPGGFWDDVDGVRFPGRLAQLRRDAVVVARTAASSRRRHGPGWRRSRRAGRSRRRGPRPRRRATTAPSPG